MSAGVTVVIAGADDEGVAAALEAAGAEVRRVDGVATQRSLAAVDIADADVLLLTDMDDATAISVAKDANPDVRVVTYATDSLPEFARAQADLALDPALFSPELVADELV
ncbi:CTP synthetase [Salinigranum rubrum]|uniref:CTP synthetase n=1 Tax=Salinigranum rubrum TaxID=755307 RepID=A0A2I8VM39_9EURY|nr:CTP synthetase [Salinigranum rubrum]AUV82990.1 CTP synthetase [Salinigranum rubrum]